MMALLRTIRWKEQGPISGQIKSMLVTSRTAKCMVMEFLLIQAELSIKANGKMGESMEKEHKYFHLELNMLVDFKLERDAARELTPGQLSHHTQEISLMEISMVKVGCNNCNHFNYIGHLKWFNGNEYNGGWKNNQRQGHGVYRYKNGIIY